MKSIIGGFSTFILVISFLGISRSSWAQTDATTSSSQIDSQAQPQPQPPAKPPPEVQSKPYPTRQPETDLPGNYLGGHRFVPSVLFPQPFVTPELTFGLGAATGTSNVTVGGLSKSLDLLAVSPILNIEFVPVKRLGIFINFAGVFVTGLTSEAAIIYGASIKTIFGFGAIYNLLTSESSSLSLGLTLAQPHSLAVSPLVAATNAVNQVLSTGSLDQDVTEETNLIIIQPSLTFAHTFSGPWGFLVFANGNFRKTTGDSGTSIENAFLGGVAVDFELQPLIKAPIGLTLGYARNEVPSGDGDANIINFGIFETIGPRFNAGLEIASKSASGQTSTGGVLLTRYYY